MSTDLTAGAQNYFAMNELPFHFEYGEILSISHTEGAISIIFACSKLCSSTEQDVLKSRGIVISQSISLP